MTPSSKIDKTEFKLMRDYIEENCGISINEDKAYLIEVRLTTLMVENGCKNFREFYYKAVADKTNTLRDKIIDAMTTNETLWFRDVAPFEILKEILFPQYTEEIKKGTRKKIKIWCAASSTGQEPYSIAITAYEYAKKNPFFKPEYVEIVATDISPSVLFIAKMGRYDSLAITRGLDRAIRDRYFTQQGKIWVINDEIKKLVTFKKFNLQDNFTIFGKQDIVFCRNVLIYFADQFKKQILSNIATMLRPSGYLFLGASESIINYSNEYQMMRYTRGLYYKVK